MILKKFFTKLLTIVSNGSFSSSLSVRVGEGSKYNFSHGYYIEIEGSLHKILYGQNAVCGFTDLSFICITLINFVDEAYNIHLPSFKHWFLQRCDIAITYDLQNNDNVCKYINSLRFCNFPRRKPKFYTDESFYVSGTTTTLKIYNKLLEFKKHDLKKLSNFNFDIFNFFRIISGFVRFECEIKKKKLEKVFNKKYIRCRNVNYNDLKKVWSDEFMKLLKFVDNDIKNVNDRESVKNRIFGLYDYTKANILYNFYLSIIVEGYDNVKFRTPKSTFYRNIKILKDLSINISQQYVLIDIVDEGFYFNPFIAEEIA